MGLFGFIKRTVELPLAITADVLKSPKKVTDAMMGGDVDLVSSTKNKIKQIGDEIDE